MLLHIFGNGHSWIKKIPIVCTHHVAKPLSAAAMALQRLDIHMVMALQRLDAHRSGRQSQLPARALEPNGDEEASKAGKGVFPEVLQW